MRIILKFDFFKNNLSSIYPLISLNKNVQIIIIFLFLKFE